MMCVLPFGCEQVHPNALLLVVVVIVCRCRRHHPHPRRRSVTVSVCITESIQNELCVRCAVFSLPVRAQEKKALDDFPTIRLVCF